MAADIAKQDEIERAIHDFTKELGHVDLAIVCSGTGEINPTRRRFSSAHKKRALALERRELSTSLKTRLRISTAIVLNATKSNLQTNNASLPPSSFLP